MIQRLKQSFLFIALSEGAGRLHRRLPFIPSLDLPFNRDDANRSLPWIIAFMIFLTGLFLAGGVTLNSILVKSHTIRDDTFTVQIPFESGALSERRNKVLKLLSETPGIVEAKPVEDAKLKKMIEPWLGQGDVLDALPLPVLIDVRMDASQPPDLKTLAAKIKALAPQAMLDDNKLWVAKFSEFTRMIQAVAFMLALFIVITTAAIIILASRTALKLHFKTVQLLHSFGARDDYIVRQFEWNAFLLALKGAVLGSFLAMLTYWLIGISASQLDSPLLPSFALTFPHVLVFALLPLLTALTAMGSARLAVHSLLRKMP